MRSLGTLAALFFATGMIACSDCNAPGTTPPAGQAAPVPVAERAPPIPRTLKTKEKEETAERSAKPPAQASRLAREETEPEPRTEAPRERDDASLPPETETGEAFAFAEALAAMSPDEALEALQDDAGRAFASAHYEFESGSQARIQGRASPVRGEFSIIDCELEDPSDYDSARRLWIGGLALRDVDDIFEAQIEESKSLDLTDRNHVIVTSRFSDLRLNPSGQLQGMERTLDADIESRSGNEAIIQRLELELDPTRRSEGELERPDDLCPERLTLHFVLFETRGFWSLEPREGRMSARRLRLEKSEPLADLTLEARRVSERARLFEPGQRAQRRQR